MRRSRSCGGRQGRRCTRFHGCRACTHITAFIELHAFMDGIPSTVRKPCRRSTACFVFHECTPSPFPVQRKTLAGPFRPAGYARHSQAANGSCRDGSLSLYLHREYLYGFRPGLPDPSDPPGGGFYRHMPIASCFFVCRECSRHTKSPGLQSRPGWIHSQVVKPQIQEYGKRKIRKTQSRRPTATPLQLQTQRPGADTLPGAAQCGGMNTEHRGLHRQASAG